MKNLIKTLLIIVFTLTNYNLSASPGISDQNEDLLLNILEKTSKDRAGFLFNNNKKFLTIWDKRWKKNTPTEDFNNLLTNSIENLYKGLLSVFPIPQYTIINYQNRIKVPMAGYRMINFGKILYQDDTSRTVDMSNGLLKVLEHEVGHIVYQETLAKEFVEFANYYNLYSENELYEGLRLESTNYSNETSAKLSKYRKGWIEKMDEFSLAFQEVFADLLVALKYKNTHPLNVFLDVFLWDDNLFMLRGFPNNISKDEMNIMYHEAVDRYMVPYVATPSNRRMLRGFFAPYDQYVVTYPVRWHLGTKYFDYAINNNKEQELLKVYLYSSIQILKKYLNNNSFKVPQYKPFKPEDNKTSLSDWDTICNDLINEIDSNAKRIRYLNN